MLVQDGSNTSVIDLPLYLLWWCVFYKILNPVNWDNIQLSNNLIPDNILLAVYGTLKQGFHNYSVYLNNMKPVKSGFFGIPYTLHSNGRYPMVVKANNHHQIYMEIYEIDDELFGEITELEEPFGYHIENLEIDGIAFKIYVYNKALPPNEFILVKSGNFQATINW